jgi:Cytochrome P460
MRLRYPKRARAGIADIYKYIAQHNRRAATAVVKRSIACSVVLVSAFPYVAILQAEEAPKKEVAAEEIARNYSRLRLMTPVPVTVDPIVAASCVGPLPVEQRRNLYGPHSDAVVNMYMNDLAADAFISRERSPGKPLEFPAGSVIVKEKLADFQGVGGMIKRSPGYDSAHNDWEYFYFDDPAKMEKGPITTCVQCHSRVDQRDYVFGSWYQPAVK